MPTAIDLVDHPSVDRLYASSKSLEVVGIANKRLLSNLCPGYGDPWGETRTGRAARLTGLKNSPLFGALSKGLTLECYMVSPYCEYGRTRCVEEYKINPECRRDLLKGVAAIQLLAQDLHEVKTGARAIRGSVQVTLLMENPCVSYTYARGSSGEPDIFLIGYLLRGRLGENFSRVQVQGDSGDVRSKHGAFREHIDSVEKDFLFSWTGSAVEFNSQRKMSGGYDVFLCYKRVDQNQVDEIERHLNRRGIVCWRDTESLQGGTNWEPAIRSAIDSSRCAVIFLGRSGLGLFQAAEIQALLDKEAKEKAANRQFRIVPVVLPSVKEGYKERANLGRLHWIDLRTKKKEGLDALVSTIKEANDWD